jgi:hypothetical protein
MKEKSAPIVLYFVWQSLTNQEPSDASQTRKLEARMPAWERIPSTLPEQKTFYQNCTMVDGPQLRMRQNTSIIS